MKTDNDDIKIENGNTPNINTEDNSSPVPQKDNQLFEQKFSEEEIEIILKDRAAVLAEELEEKEDDNYINIVEFYLNDEIYAFDVKYISQVTNIEKITDIPCTPPFVLGVTEAQEKIISIIDLRSFFDMQHPKENILSEKLVILEYSNISFGIIADKVIGMKKITIDSIQTNMATFDDIRKKYFYGLTKDQTIILDGSKLLQDPEIIIQ